MHKPRNRAGLVHTGDFGDPALGSMDTGTGWVSYGYPAGEAVLPTNNVVIQ